MLNYNVVLYRDALLNGGNSVFNIPGLISKDIESSTKQQDYLNAKNAEMLKALKINPSVSQSIDHATVVINPDQYTWNMPDYTQQQKRLMQDQMIWGQAIPQKQPYSPPLDMGLIEEMKRYAEGYRSPRKTAFEELIEELFSTADKEQMLMDMGYEFFVNDKGWDEFRKGDIAWNKSLDLDKVFMKEIMIKFKNLLMTKATLKLKL